MRLTTVTRDARSVEEGEDDGLPEQETSFVRCDKEILQPLVDCNEAPRSLVEKREAGTKLHHGTT